MFKKSGILLSCNLHSFQTPSSSKTSSYPASLQKQQRRSYAMVSDGHSRHNHGQHRWPELTSANTIPTPYQIFGQKKGSSYSKKRFYELVKQYHPDKHDLDDVDGLSYATKLERYRLVVAANNILSDPVRRSAYDCYGAGWNGAPDVAQPRDSSEPATTWGTYSGRGWAGGPNGPSQNATWEDWEKWYQRDAKGPQEPRFVSNSAFVALIMIFATLGGIGQATRVSNNGINFLEQRDTLHNNVSKDLMRRRRETTTIYSTREERIHSFLKQRDPNGHGFLDPRDVRLLPPPDERSSEHHQSRTADVQHQKGNPKEG